MTFGLRIGLAVTPEQVGAVVVRGRMVEWSALEWREPEETTGDAITRLLRALPSFPAPGWLRPQVWVAIDAIGSRVRTIRGLPTVTDARLVAQIIATTPERFFIGTPRGLVMTNVLVIEPSSAQAAVFDIDLLEDIQNACSSIRLQVSLFVPTSVAENEAQGNESFSKAASSDNVPLILATAYGATLLSHKAPLVAVSTRQMCSVSPTQHKRVMAAGITASMAILMALTAPGVIAVHTNRYARHIIAGLAPARAQTLAKKHDINIMTRSLASVDSFEQHRLSKTILLSRLTQALPITAIITAFKSDTTETTITILAQETADVVKDIEEIVGVSHAQIIGPVTREPIHKTSSPENPVPALADSLERVTVRFRFTEDIQSVRRPLDQGRKSVDPDPVAQDVSYPKSAVQTIPRHQAAR